MHSSKRLKLTIKSKPAIPNPFITLPEIRHELYEYVPAKLIGKLGLLSKGWKQSVSNEHFDLKKIVLRLIHLKSTDDDDYQILIREKLANNPLVLQIKNKEVKNLWETILSHLLYQTPITDEHLVKALFSLEPKYALDFTYLTIDRNEPDSISVWEEIADLLMPNYHANNISVNITKIASIMSQLPLLKDTDDNLIRFITLSLEPILLTLKKDWTSLRENVAKSKLPIYRNLIGNNFNYVKLENLNFDFSDFNRARFIKAIIKKSRFNQSMFWNAKLNSAQAQECQFINSYMFNIDASYINLNKAILNYSVLEEAEFKNADLSDAYLEWTTLTNAKMNSANCRNAIFSHATMHGISLIDANLTGATLTEASICNANLSFITLDKAKCDKTDFSGTNLDNASICTTDLTTAILTNTSCYQAMFFGSIMTDDLEAHVLTQGGFITLSDYIDTLSDTEIADESFEDDLTLYTNKYIQIIKDCFDDPNLCPNFDWLELDKNEDEMNDDESIIGPIHNIVVQTEQWLAQNRIPNHFSSLNPNKLETACRFLDEVLDAYKILHGSMLNKKTPQSVFSAFRAYIPGLR